VDLLLLEAAVAEPAAQVNLTPFAQPAVANPAATNMQQAL
jgi:hypothetical protein